MQRLSIYFLAIGLFYAACTPRTTEAVVKTPEMKAPKIEIPSGPDVRKNAPKPGTPPSIQVGSANTFTTANGMQVIVVENHKLPRVSFQVYLDNDPVLEKNAAGYLDMMGNLLSKGTTTKSKAEIDEAVDFIGASLGTSASGVRGESLTRHADKLLAIMSDVLMNPSFPEEEFQKVKKQAASGLAQAKEDPNSIAGNVRAVLNYGKNHPYGEVMTEETLENISVEQMKNYYTKYFKANKAYFVVVGDVTPEQVRAWTNRYFGTWAKGEVPTHNYNNPASPSKAQVDFVNKNAAVQSVINVTYPVEFTPGHPDAIKAAVMNTLLGGYFNSRLNANLREDKAYTYGARSSLDSDELIGEFNAYASVRNEVTDSAVAQFLFEIERLRTEPVPEKELSLVKNVLTGSFARGLERPETVARFALNKARYNLPDDYYETYLEKLAAVSVDDIQAMAQKYLRPDKAHILVVGSKKDVADKLGAFGKVNFYDAYGNAVEDMSGDVPSELSATDVLKSYANAIGGKAALDKVEDVDMIGTMEGMGMPIGMRTALKKGNKMLVEVTMNGQVLNRQVMNGNVATMQQMGGPAEGVPIDRMEEMQAQSTLFRETKYNEMGYFAELTSAEVFEGEKAFVLTVTSPSGRQSTEYYSMKTGLKLGEVSQQSNGEESVTISTSYSDYQEINGVKFPMKSTVSGAFPMPMVIRLSEVKVNSGLGDEVFSVE